MTDIYDANQPPARPTGRSEPLMVSFSGIDGAGKSTQIDALVQAFTASGNRVLLLSFWDDVAALTRFREGMSHKVLKGDKGVGHPDKPLNRRDKNVKSWYMTIARLFFYTVDTLRTNLITAKARRSGADLIIFDRYAYDEFANLLPGGLLTRLWLRVLLRFTPRPHVAYLLDADPERARERKPEYPLDFLYSNRQAYLTLSAMAGMTVIPALTVPEVSRRILDEARKFGSVETASPARSPQMDSLT
jgi:thymidylate kinase